MRHGNPAGNKRVWAVGALLFGGVLATILAERTAPINLADVSAPQGMLPAGTSLDQAVSGSKTVDEFIARLQAPDEELSGILRKERPRIQWNRLSENPSNPFEAGHPFHADSIVLEFSGPIPYSALRAFSRSLILGIAAPFPVPSLGASASGATIQIPGLPPTYFFAWQRGNLILGLIIIGEGGPTTEAAATAIAVEVDRKARLYAAQ